METFTVFHGAARPFVARGAHQCRLLRFASRYPGWHSFTGDRAAVRAVSALAARGVLDVCRGQFRINWGLRPTVAWTGGSKPRAWGELGASERAKVRQLWRDACRLYVGRWGNLLPPSGRADSCLLMARTFWKHARYDAHATYRD